MSAIDTAALRKLIDKHGPPLSPMLIFTLLDEIDRLSADRCDWDCDACHEDCEESEESCGEGCTFR